MMNIINTIILGIIQGIAEFLPISSSAHLIIFRDLFKIGATMSSKASLCFDLALHFGTLLAIGIFFFKDFINMIKTGLTKGPKDREGKLFYQIILATIPAAIIGVLFEDVITSYVRNNYLLIAFALIAMGVIIYLVDKTSKSTKTIKDIAYKDAFLIGCSQIFALIPGFSRSGTTIASSRYLKIERESAAKFSFYLSAPVVLGACVLQFLKKGTIALIMANALTFFIGVFISFITGLLCIKFLLKYLKNHDFKLFMIYRIILAIIVILTLIF